MEQQVGCVVIGRNEGDRLKRCLRSVIRQANKIVYVDSGSTDGSMAFAASLGITVAELDMSTPFSAGRARNEGFFHLVGKYCDLKYVQFIDGDCELVEGWLEFARKHLNEQYSWAIVAGRRQELHPEQSVFNHLCDMEWDTPVGEAKACGGDFMIRCTAFQESKGFNPEVIAGEEPELCYRLRQNGWKIYRLDHPMTVHDAAIFKVSQWWNRSLRSGHAYAQGYALHGKETEKYCFLDSLRIWFWTFILPLLVGLSTFMLDPKFIFLSILYPLHIAKNAAKVHTQLVGCKWSLIYTIFILLGKFPQLLGQILFLIRYFFKKKYSIIEYNKK